MLTLFDQELPTSVDLPLLDEFQREVQQANAGDHQAITKLRRLLDANPRIWRSIGDLGQHLENTLIEAVAQGDVLLAESVRRQAHELREELLGASTNRIERLAVDRVVVSWLHVQQAEKLLRSAVPGTRKATYYTKRRQTADRLFAQAIESLAKLRKLLPRKGGP